MSTRMIGIEEAEAGMKLSEGVYITTTSGSSMLAARKGTVLDENTIKMFKTRNVRSIEIFGESGESDIVGEPSRAAAGERVVMSAAPSAPAPAASPAPAAPAKVQHAPEPFNPVSTVIDKKKKDEAVDSVRKLFDVFTAEGGVNKTTAYQCVENLNKVVGDLLDVISGDANGLIHINDLKDFDEYTYHHSLSVSMLSMATGRVLGLKDDELQRLGRCAMLHDIGKQMIPADIIKKKGKLTDAEFATIKTHPILGANNLKTNSLGDVELWNGVLFHHEKVNGSGYPKGLKGKDIPLFSKIISVADVYDAVTSYRSYRLPMLPSEAFAVISKDINVAFEYDIVKAFFAKLDLYPINTILELSDGRLGLVVEAEGASRLRPTIRVWGSTELVDLAAASNSHIGIAGVINPADLPPGYSFQ